MYKGKKIGVVVPCFNEERLVSRVIETMPEVVDRMFLVDDASSDDTARIIAEHAKRQPERIVLVRHEENQGVGGAIATGYKLARDEGLDVAVVMAGDAQMDPDDLPRILEPVVSEGYDYAKGNRLFTGDAWNKIPRIRYLGNAFLSVLTKIASGYWHVADSQSGFTAINLPALKRIDWDQMYKRYGQPNDLLVRLNVYNFRVKDVPIRPVYGIGERSGIRPLKMIPHLSWLLFRLFLYRLGHKYIIRDFHPLVFFYMLGMVMLPAGALFGAYLVAVRLLGSSVAGTSALFAAFMVITGLQFLFFAMWFDMDYNKELK